MALAVFLKWNIYAGMINSGDFVEGKAEKSHSVISAILADNSMGMRLKQCCKPYNIIVYVYIYIYYLYTKRTCDFCLASWSLPQVRALTAAEITTIRCCAYFLYVYVIQTVC